MLYNAEVYFKYYAHAYLNLCFLELLLGRVDIFLKKIFTCLPAGPSFFLIKNQQKQGGIV